MSRRTERKRNDAILKEEHLNFIRYSDVVRMYIVTREKVELSHMPFQAENFANSVLHILLNHSG